MVRIFQIVAFPFLCSSFPPNFMMDQWIAQTDDRGCYTYCGRCLVGLSLLAISPFGFLVGVGDGSGRYNQINTYVIRILPFGC